MSPRKILNVWFVLLIAAALLSLTVAAGCGEKTEKSANDTDKAFVEVMLPHHAMAVAAAQYQIDNGKEVEIKDVATEVLNGRMNEISELNRIGKLIGAKMDEAHLSAFTGSYDRAESGAVDPNAAAALPKLGFTVEEAAMDMKLYGALDKEFAAAMVPYAEAAVEIARVQLEKGENPTLNTLAENFVKLQTRQLTELREQAR